MPQEDGEPAFPALTAVTFPWKCVKVFLNIRRTTEQHRHAEIKRIVGGHRWVNPSLFKKFVFQPDPIVD